MALNGYTQWDPREDGWLSGFTDGEGSFQINFNRGRNVMRPHFGVLLRVDDAPVLHELQAAFGGAIGYRKAQGPSAPSCRWEVGGKQGLLELVRYFDRFPLRAKKAGDYKLWRQAVQIYVAHGYRDQRLWAIRDALIAGRVFNPAFADAPDVVEPFDVQMALGID